MPRLTLGIILGLVCGLASVAVMLPMDFPDKRAALIGAFVNRFALGLFSATAILPLHPIASGLVVGLMLSVPDAVITKAYIPIIGLGAVFGLLCGVAVWLLAR